MEFYKGFVIYIVHYFFRLQFPQHLNLIQIRRIFSTPLTFLPTHQLIFSIDFVKANSSLEKEWDKIIKVSEGDNNEEWIEQTSDGGYIII